MGNTWSGTDHIKVLWLAAWFYPLWNSAWYICPNKVQEDLNACSSIFICRLHFLVLLAFLGLMWSLDCEKGGETVSGLLSWLLIDVYEPSFEWDNWSLKSQVILASSEEWFYQNKYAFCNCDLGMPFLLACINSLDGMELPFFVPAIWWDVCAMLIVIHKDSY